MCDFFTSRVLISHASRWKGARKPEGGFFVSSCAMRRYKITVKLKMCFE